MCQRCFRGHAYCGEECAKTARQKSNRTSQKKFRDSDEGKVAHKEQEQDRRDRKKKEESSRVGKQGSSEDLSSIIVPVPYADSAETRWMELTTGTEVSDELNQKRKIAQALEAAFEARRPNNKAHRCWVCGCIGHIVPAFPNWATHYPTRNQPLLR
jgi:hypothetical protein